MILLGEFRAQYHAAYEGQPETGTVRGAKRYCWDLRFTTYSTKSDNTQSQAHIPGHTHTPVYMYLTDRDR